MTMRRWRDVEGRSRRREMWWFYAVYTVLVFASVWLFAERVVATTATEYVAALTSSPLPFHFQFRTAEAVTFVRPGLATLAVILLHIVPATTLCVRRLHDIGTTGWLAAVLFIPGLGQIGTFVLALIDGTRGPNTYDLDPRDAPNTVAPAELAPAM